MCLFAKQGGGGSINDVGPAMVELLPRPCHVRYSLRTMRILLTLLAVISFSVSAQPPAQPKRMGADDLIALSNGTSADMAAAITASFDAASLKAGTAWISHGPHFFFAIESATPPSLVVNDTAPVPMTHVLASNLWYQSLDNVKVGASHTFHYVVDGAAFGGSVDMPAFGPMSYATPGVPQGKLSEKHVHVSRIYDGMKSDYWVYVPAQYNPKVPAALMVFTDGQSYIRREGNLQALNVFDNLIAAHKMPVTIFVMTSPGDVTDSPGTPTYQFVSHFAAEQHRTLKDAMRSTEYDTVSDRYAHFLVDELLPEALAGLNVRTDAYSRAISGSSSGGICAFNVAWQTPDQFSRVQSWIGSFTAIQWHERPDVTAGGQDFPDMVLRGPKRNIRVWSQDGANDQEKDHGSWPLDNIRMANAFHINGYDFHFSFGKGTHNPAQGEAEMPESMGWLWRDYDPAKFSQPYEQDATEKAKPVFRVAIVNR
jgi:enterochelin esterase-like enzyme